MLPWEGALTEGREACCSLHFTAGSSKSKCAFGRDFYYLLPKQPVSLLRALASLKPAQLDPFQQCYLGHVKAGELTSAQWLSVRLLPSLQ